MGIVLIGLLIIGTMYTIRLWLNGNAQQDRDDQMSMAWRRDHVYRSGVTKVD